MFQQCSMCPFVASRAVDILRHNLKTHSNNSMCRTPANKIKAEKIQCQFCPFSSIRAKSIENHVQTFHTNYADSPASDQNNTSTPKLTKTKCHFCSFMGLKPETMMKHILSKHPNRTENDSMSSTNDSSMNTSQTPGKINCLYCSFSAVNAGNMINHVAQQHSDGQQTNGNEVADNQENMNNVTQNTDSRYKRSPKTKCQFCAFTAVKALSMNNHVQSKHAGRIQEMPAVDDNKQSPVKILRKCTLCTFTNEFSYVMAKHFVQEHGNKLPLNINRQGPENTNKPEQCAQTGKKCHLCSLILASSSRLLMHMQSSHPNVIQNLKTHADSTDEQVTPEIERPAFKEEQVSNSHVTNSNLVNQQKAQINKKKRVIPKTDEIITPMVKIHCDLKMPLIKEEQERKNHNTQVTAEETDTLKFEIKMEADNEIENSSTNGMQLSNPQCNFFCKNCNESFVNRVSVLRHQLDIHSNPKPPTTEMRPAVIPSLPSNEHSPATHLKAAYSGKDFACSHCNKTFSKEDKLRKHTKKNHTKKAVTETGQKDYSTEQTVWNCNACPKTFPTKILVKIHTRKVHYNSFTCRPCGKQFDGEYQLLNHEKENHTMDKKGKEYTCKYCRKSFSREDKMIKHTLKRHPTNNNFNMTI